MLKQLRHRLTMMCACITGVILCAMAVVSLAVSEAQLSEQAQLAFQNNISTIALRMQMEEVVNWAWLSQTEAAGGLLLHIEENNRPLLFTSTFAADTSRAALVGFAQETARQHNVDVSKRPATALETPRAVFELTAGRGEKYRAGVVVLRTKEGFKSLTVLQNLRDEQMRVLMLRAVFGGIVLAGILLLTGFSWWFSSRATRPVAESRQRQSEFIAAASHELRTPLTVIRASASALGYEVRGEPLRFVQAIDRECVRTGRLVDDLLTLANVDANSWSIVWQPVEIDSLLQEIKEDFAAVVQKKGQTLAVELQRNALPLLAGDEQRLKQTLAILLDNALRYTPEYGKIILQAGRHKNGIRIQVIDNGPGIAEEYKAHVFERFYRVDKNRTQKEHYGLGMSIAWELVRLHGGKIFMRDTEGGGLTVVIDFPLREPKIPCIT